MQSLGIEPDKIILASVLWACGSLGALDYGRWVHEYIDRNGGLAMHGHGHEALKTFEEMTRSGTRPNAVTFLAILTACCHSGLVDEGCRAGLLGEARELINTMPMEPDVLIWGALLSACKAKGDIELSQEILDRLLKKPQDSGAYVLLSNIYAINRRWVDVKRVRKLMKKKGIQKSPESSVIEVDGKAHEFVVGDTSHPRKDDIHMFLNILAKQVYLEGIFPIHS
ncbi:hypothetical protein COP2_043084 [Malus domestica]